MNHLIWIRKDEPLLALKTYLHNGLYLKTPLRRAATGARKVLVKEGPQSIGSKVSLERTYKHMTLRTNINKKISFMSWITRC